MPPDFRFATPEAEAMMRRMEADAKARHAAAVAKYGPETRALAPCLRERELHSVGTLLLLRGTDGRAPSLMGWTSGPARTLPPEVRREIGGAVRLPANVAGTWAEYRHWQERAEVRAAFRPEEDAPLWVKARIALLEERLDTLPARDRDDVLARLDWMAAVLDLGFSRPIEEDEACLATLRQDIVTGAVPLPERTPEEEQRSVAASDIAPDSTESDEASAQADETSPALPAPPPAPGTGSEPVHLGQAPRTRDEARAAVRALLPEALTDREIARRVGVSPSTVAAVRKAAQSDGPPP